MSFINFKIVLCLFQGLACVSLLDPPHPAVINIMGVEEKKKKKEQQITFCWHVSWLQEVVHKKICVLFKLIPFQNHPTFCPLLFSQKPFFICFSCDVVFSRALLKTPRCWLRLLLSYRTQTMHLSEIRCASLAQVIDGGRVSSFGLPVKWP